jgi:hypothetical protein
MVVAELDNFVLQSVSSVLDTMLTKGVGPHEAHLRFRVGEVDPLLQLSLRLPISESLLLRFLARMVPP